MGVRHVVSSSCLASGPLSLGVPAQGPAVVAKEGEQILLSWRAGNTLGRRGHCELRMWVPLSQSTRFKAQIWDGLFRGNCRVRNVEVRKSLPTYQVHWDKTAKGFSVYRLFAAQGAILVDGGVPVFLQCQSDGKWIGNRDALHSDDPLVRGCAMAEEAMTACDNPDLCGGVEEALKEIERNRGEINRIGKDSHDVLAVDLQGLLQICDTAAARLRNGSET